MAYKFDRAKLAYKLGATFDYQQDVIVSNARFKKIVKARQIGMTTALAIDKLIRALTYDDYVILIVSPSFRQSGRMMRYIKKAFYKLEQTLKAEIPTQKWTNEEVFFPNGSEIHSLPNSPKTIQGYDCDDATVDEAGLFADIEGNELIDAIVGSLAAKQGTLTLSGRPHGKRGLLWAYFDPASDRGKNFAPFKITWEDRARSDKAYGEEVLKHKEILSPIQFDEIYRAEFIEEGVLIFPYSLLESAHELWENNNFVLMGADGRPKEDKPRYIGIDFGRKRSLTEIHVLQKENPNLYRSLALKSLDNVNFERQKSYIDDIIKRMQPKIVMIDERGMGLPLLDYLQGKHGESMVKPLTMSNLKNKEKSILDCRNAFTDLKLAIPRHEELINQLHAFQKEYTDAGNVKYFGKVDETDFKDDKVIALVAAWQATLDKPFHFEIA